MKLAQAEKALIEGKEVSRRAWGNKVKSIFMENMRKYHPDKMELNVPLTTNTDIYEFIKIRFSDDYYKVMDARPEPIDEDITEGDVLKGNFKVIEQKEKYKKGGKCPKWIPTKEDVEANDYYIV